MHADEVSVAQRLAEVDIFDPVFVVRYSARVAQVHGFLDGFDEFVILISRVVAQNVHIEAGALFDQRQPDASRADDGDRFAGNFIAEEWQVRMPVSPLVFPREVLGWPHLARKYTS